MARTATLTQNVAMNATLGTTEQHAGRTADPAVQPAIRTRPPGWRDPRMWVGIALVAVSVLAGARIIGEADDTVQVWSTAADLAAGQSLTSDDLVATNVHFSDASEFDNYLLVAEQLPARATLARAVGEGEMVPRTALSQAGSAGVSTLPLVLPSLAIPPSLSPGTRVNVWSVNEKAKGFAASIILEDVEVVGVPSGADGFGAALERQLLLGIEADQQDAVAAALEAAADGTLTVQRRG